MQQNLKIVTFIPLSEIWNEHGHLTAQPRQCRPRCNPEDRVQSVPDVLRIEARVGKEVRDRESLDNNGLNVRNALRNSNLR